MAPAEGGYALRLALRAGEDGLVSDVADHHRLAHTVGPEQDRVDALLDEAEREEVVDGLPVDLLRPRPVEIGDGPEGTDARLAQARPWLLMTWWLSSPPFLLRPRTTGVWI